MKSQKHNADACQKRRETHREMLGLNTFVSTGDGLGKVIGYDMRTEAGT